MTSINRSWQERAIATNGIRLHVLEQGEGPVVLLLHGFPELAYSWRYQLPALAAAGYHAIAPDLRGYGASDKPAGVEQYDIHHLVADLIGLLDAVGAERAAVVGHDWGAIITWRLALLRPERVAAVAALNVPYQGREPGRPTDLFKLAPDGRFNYILNFQNPEAHKALDADVRNFLGRTYRAVGGPGDWLSPADLEVYIRAFEQGGFDGPLNYYRNFDRNWETTPELAQRQCEQPALMIMAELDPVLKPGMEKNMERAVPGVRHLLIAGSGHWTQQEKPDEVNQALIAFLHEVYPS